MKLICDTCDIQQSHPFIEGDQCCHCDGRLKEMPAAPGDPVERPSHYTSHPSGIECIEVTEHMGFCLGNAMKYIWRAGLKGDNQIEDLRKARWYIDRELLKMMARIPGTEDRPCDSLRSG